jgi:hypothetical protein
MYKFTNVHTRTCYYDTIGCSNFENSKRIRSNTPPKKKDKKRKKQTVTQTWRSQVTVIGQGHSEAHRSGTLRNTQVRSGLRSGVPKNAGQVQVSGQGVPET